MRSSVESRNAPNGRALARHPRVAAVERVADRADDERDAAEEEVLLPDEHGGDDAEGEAGERDRVRREPRLDQPVAHERLVLARRRARRPLDRWGAHGGRILRRSRCGAGGAARLPGPDSGRARANSPCAQTAATAATTAPRKASIHQWLAVATTTKVTTGA